MAADRCFIERQSIGSVLQKQNADCLKSIFAVLIIASHIRGTTTSLNDTPIGMMLTAAGYLSVAVFFFFSGYGLSLQLQSKGKAYLDTFPFKRLISFYCKYIIISAVYLLVGFCVTQSVFFGQVPRIALMLHSNIYGGWYMQAIMLVYILFYLAERFFPVSPILKKLLIYALYVCCTFLFVSDIPLYIQSSAALLLGLLLPFHRSKVELTLQKKSTFGLVYLGTFLLFCVTLLLGNLNILPDAPKLIAKTLSALLFVIFVLLSSTWIRLSNPITRFLAGYSLEIYVFHGIFINLYHGILPISNYVLYSAAVLASTIALSILLHPLLRSVDTMFGKLFRKCPSCRT